MDSGSRKSDFDSPIVKGGCFFVLALFLLAAVVGSCSSSSGSSSSDSYSVEEYTCRGCTAKSTRPFHGNDNGLDGYCPSCVQKIITRQILIERSRN